MNRNFLLDDPLSKESCFIKYLLVDVLDNQRFGK